MNYFGIYFIIFQLFSHPLHLTHSVCTSQYHIHLINNIKARLHIEYPMLFEIHNRGENRKMHSGVLEFVADEGKCFMPFWVCI